MQTLVKQTIIGFILTILYVCNASTQTPVYYGYDGNGNRKVRSIVLSETKSAKADTSTNKQANRQKPETFSDNLGDIKIVIYPNPTQGQLKIDLEGYQENVSSGLYLYSLSGSLVTSKSPVKSSNELILSGYPIGTYILKIVIGDKKSEWKIIKE